MPDILIQGYSAPASCATCNFNSNAFCDVLGRKVKIPVDYIERPDICPLHELPPHGDLIDMDKIRYTELYGGVEVTTANWIDNLPVVVPAERSGADAYLIETNLFDIEEIHPNCTVQVLTNSVTGDFSVGWWENEEGADSND